MTPPETVNIIIATAIACISAGAGLTAFMGRFVTKDHLEKTTEKLEEGIHTIGETLTELTAIVSEQKVLSERITHAHKRIDAMEHRKQ